MRILIGSPARLDARLGVSQIAMNLAAACRGLGVEVVLWEPPATPAGPWWTLLRRNRRSFLRLAREAGPFDLVDAVSWMIQPALREVAPKVCVRNVQPDLNYLDFGASASTFHPVRRLAEAAQRFDTRRVIVYGWKAADRILTLGTAERESMESTHGELAGKLRSYFIAPSPSDRAELRTVARNRTGGNHFAANARFIWIGRWARHKGTARLVAFANDFLGRHPGASLTIAGTGTRDLHDASYVREVRDQIRVVPYFERGELPALLAVHHAGLFTSEVEGWGLSLQEMLESGMPVYATRAGAVQDLEPWFPSQLRAFPPRPEDDLALPASLDFDSYASRFDWRRIASDYLDAVLGAEVGD
jgi:glycosyltransferase involved in cell wall biosynthesis